MLSEKEKEKICRLRSEGLSIYAIKRKTNHAINTINTVLKEFKSPISAQPIISKSLTKTDVTVDELVKMVKDLLKFVADLTKTQSLHTTIIENIDKRVTTLEENFNKKYLELCKDQEARIKELNGIAHSLMLAKQPMPKLPHV